MRRFDIATLSVQTGTVAAALGNIECHLASSSSERSRIRAEAVARGTWPPEGGPNWLTVMQSMICVPAKFSPLHCGEMR